MYATTRQPHELSVLTLVARAPSLVLGTHSKLQFLTLPEARQNQTHATTASHMPPQCSELCLVARFISLV